MEHSKLITTLLDGIMSLSDRPEMMDAGTCTGECNTVDAQTSTVEECRGDEDQRESSMSIWRKKMLIDGLGVWSRN